MWLYVVWEDLIWLPQYRVLTTSCLCLKVEESQTDDKGSAAGKTPYPNPPVSAHSFDRNTIYPISSQRKTRLIGCVVIYHAASHVTCEFESAERLNRAEGPDLPEQVGRTCTSTHHWLFPPYTHDTLIFTFHKWFCRAKLIRTGSSSWSTEIFNCLYRTCTVKPWN